MNQNQQQQPITSNSNYDSNRINTDFTPAGYLDFFFFFKPDTDNKYKFVLSIKEGRFVNAWISKIISENNLDSDYFPTVDGYYKIRATTYYKPKVFSNSKMMIKQYLAKGDYINMKLAIKSYTSQEGKNGVYFDCKYITKINNKTT